MKYMYSIADKQNHLTLKINNKKELSNLKVLIGKNDWLYLDNDTNRSLDQISGKLLFNEKKLFKWKLILETRYSFLNALGIKYFYLAAPNKECIYPENLPDYVKLSEQRPINQLREYISSSNILPKDFILYPDQELIAAKSNRLTYPQGDTHWTVYGGYLAYRALANRISQQIDLNIIDESEISFEETRILGDLGDKVPSFPKLLDYIANHDRHSRYIFDNHVRNTGHLTIWENELQDLPKAVIFHDSFNTRMLGFWAESFSRLVLVHQPNLDYKVILDEKPDLVISQQVERFLIRIPDDLNDLSNEDRVAKKVEEISKNYNCQHINMPSDNSSLLYAWCLGSPKPNGRLDLYNLRGWIIGKDLPVAAIEIVDLDRDRIIEQASVNILRPDVLEVHPVTNAEMSGFEIEMPGMMLTLSSELPAYNLLIRAVLSDGRIVPLRMLKLTKN
jgi:alginate O-acetyltransferase complex protein AlgJ